MADTVPAPVKKCVDILRGAETDTEKFAALFMVTKLVKGSDCNAHSKKLILEAIGFKFLKRLLLSTDVPVDCPPMMYKSVALSVLSSFCSEPELATHPEILSNIPVFLQIVEQADDDALEDNLMAINEAYECLHNIASTEAGQKALLDVGAVTKMCEIYSHQSFQTDEALNILVILVSRFGPSSWGNNIKPLHSILTKIALDFETDHSERKFELCSILNALLFNCCKTEVAATAGEETWPGSIYKGLNDILTSKIGKNQRDPAMKLASLMVDICGVEWTLSDEEKPRQFFLLLVQLCSVEVRMQLEDKQLPQILSNADLITSCFVILELSISYVAQDTIDLEQKEKQSLYTALKGAFTAVINTLSKLAKKFEKEKNEVSTQEKIFTTAMVRVLGAWLAQETSAMRNAVYEIFPFMLSIANNTFYASRERKIRERNIEEGGTATPMEVDDDPMGQVDVLRFLLPALCHLTVEEKARKIMLNTKEEEVFYEALVFHWGNVQVKRPKIPKAERLKMKSLPEPEYTPKQLEDMKDSRAAMISLCNIFMNITVLEAKLVEESQVFANLLKFIFSNQPELKNQQENLVLYGNLSILGLLVLKQQAKRMRKNDFAICRFIQAAIRFLWDAYCVDESVDARSLSVSMKYKEYWTELMELWFLGMQTMSGVLALIPWVSEFAMESGWAEGIITMLHQVKMGSLPSNTKSAYEDFLCNLVEANKDVIKVLKSHDALTVCRTHHFMELGKKLFGD
ncbi:UNVERIFIED_CONTAM: hypothetical protein PYX00_007568 [Menopon gallinae]|uniref:Neurochondrin-like protein n=1 Tax=Menopon gallinae TaxID=328185 RepID=A0AAW2HJF8_9NEOP